MPPEIPSTIRRDAILMPAWEEDLNEEAAAEAAD
jgi:hypothetical protein